MITSILTLIQLALWCTMIYGLYTMFTASILEGGMIFIVATAIAHEVVALSNALEQ